MTAPEPPDDPDLPPMLGNPGLPGAPARTWPTGDELHRLHGETARQAKAFIAHYLRRDDEAILATAPQHLRDDPESWYFVMALVAEVGSLARVLYGGPEGAEVWARERIRRFHEDNPDVL